MSEFRPVRLTDEQRIDWLRLIRAENVGPRTFRSLIRQYNSAKRAIENLPDLARRGGGSKLQIPTRDESAKEIAAAARIGVKYIGVGEIEYPSSAKLKMHRLSSPSADDTLRACVQNLLGPAPVSVDDLVREAKVPAAAVQNVLLELELAGRLERQGGGLVAARSRIAFAAC